MKALTLLERLSRGLHSRARFMSLTRVCEFDCVSQEFDCEFESVCLIHNMKIAVLHTDREKWKPSETFYSRLGCNV